ncbi:MAG TPA: lytic transglycosylase domain-containing protein [Methylobacterium sp.]|uniref:lytic transglycosylase domain-containing protein n=1 Tax=Methylorubrum sp. B1-46 TaxID=2897334 RepID=UPI001E3925FB|nr:lytic transglycosylase domain-containing protein [Methylorubrum sp. B1-46]UGB26091.1 lytic transglycosylase domain-containing protein [Methylorubrum sp. B1-46]HEV2543689.1 lytic transglycosylase domain-containing protein [Methylobacterium sp.]
MRGLLPRMAPALVAAALVAFPSQADVRARVAVLDLTAPAQTDASSEPQSAGMIAIVEKIAPGAPVSAIAALIAQAAASTGVPSDFLLKLLKRESGLNPMAVSPKGALGIAQFMPATAAERGLADPFDPVQAIPKAAELLRDLRQRYGNWALAAAAYNAGPGRVDAWLVGRLELPKETVDYVANITGVNTPSWTSAYRPTGPVWPLQLASLAPPMPLFSVASDATRIRVSDRRETGADAKRMTKPADGTAAPLTTAQLRAAAGGLLRSAGASSPCAALLNSAAQCLNFSRY